MSPSKKFIAWPSSKPFHGLLRRVLDPFVSPRVQNFASRSFTYYASNVSTSSINTPFAPNEDLNSEYNGGESGEAGAVKTETISGCGGCG
jgi:hypothetical protein